MIGPGSCSFFDDKGNANKYIKKSQKQPHLVFSKVTRDTVQLRKQISDLAEKQQQESNIDMPARFTGVPDCDLSNQL